MDSALTNSGARFFRAAMPWFLGCSNHVHKPSVIRSAASTRLMSFKWPNFVAMALSKMVAKLSVITMESVRSRLLWLRENSAGRTRGSDARAGRDCW